MPGSFRPKNSIFKQTRFPSDLDILQERYATELRWQLGVPKREDRTMQLWLDAIREDRGIAPVAGEQ